MASLNLAIDDTLLRRARAALAQFEAVGDGSFSASGAPWTRESLHERG
jgi:hypothetical protein